MARQNTIAQAQNLCCFMFHFPPFPDASAGAVSAGQTDREASGLFSPLLPCVICLL